MLAREIDDTEPVSSVENCYGKDCKKADFYYDDLLKFEQELIKSEENATLLAENKFKKDKWWKFWKKKGIVNLKTDSSVLRNEKIDDNNN